uniref:isopentenyl-diphosphate Delta-isomerase n=1 Tax=Phallusia mammillata TaxID=59560 RepID=A0A6F9DFM2_9ASCI|nr:isopentenyl-diphosphate Delta-isomerase 1-like [Phallusia mammillata]
MPMARLDKLRIAQPIGFVKRFLNTKVDLGKYDPTQVGLMNENCIAVNENDHVTGQISKMECHLNENGPPLHRAFSLFLFNSNKELLMQKRASSKITFPGFYTNTCCSHPLFCEREMDDTDALGIKKAAQRRALYELGIPEEQLPISLMQYITRVHYKAPSGELWGEHEIDYVLFAQQDVKLNVNKNEVSEVQWVSLENLQDFMDKCMISGTPLTPWFQLITKTQLRNWWSNLHRLNDLCDHKNITRF